MRNLDREDKNKRTFSFMFLVSILFLLLISRLYYLQILKSEEYANKAARNSLRTNVLKPVRGKIYDKNGEILVSNTTGYHLIHKESQNISDKELEILKSMYNKSSEEQEKLLANLTLKSKEKLKLIYSDIIDLIKISNQDFSEVANIFYKVLPEGFDKVLIISEDLDVNMAYLNVEKNSNPRIDIIEYNKRYYHKKEIASHIIGNVKLINEKEYNELKDSGYSKNDLIGKDGIEKYYDKVLKGIAGKEYVEVDARGNILNKLDEEKSVSGENIYLSIDYTLQKYMNDIFGLSLGTFIAIDVKTGKILTYVSLPEIDLNLLSSRISKEKWDELLNSKRRPLLNRGIAGLFPPGSTAKIVSGAAILEAGISPNATMYSTGEFTYGKVKFRDSHRQGHGITNFYKSIAESVNTYYYMNILKINREEYFKIAKNFGIGELTEIDIPGELKGVLPTPDWKKQRFKDKASQLWLPGDLINMSIGQGYMLTTPMQVLMMYQAIANNGTMLKPTFIEYFESQNGIKKQKEVEILRKLELKEKTIKDIQDALKLTVKIGTAKNLAVLPIDVSVKTGTAQNSSGEDHSWMAGYFPSDNPEIAFVALVENGGYGSVSAGSKVIEFVNKYYEIKGMVKE